MNAPLAPLFGLVLAGGASRRMGRDKAALTPNGLPQLEWTYALLSRHCDRTFVSIRRDQADDPLRRALPGITDLQEGLGPIAGIAAAQAARPDCAWLVLACDLPRVDDASLQRLIDARDGRPVVAYRSTHDGLPEPLCAIYEPQTRAGIAEFIAAGRNCPRKFVIGTGVALLEQPHPAALDNVNTPEELASLTSSAGPVKSVHVQYFAVLREQARRSEETRVTSAATPAELYEESRREHGFTLPRAMLRVAVNDEFRDWSTPLADADRVVFIPPVAGG